MKLAHGTYAFIAPKATGAFISGNSVLIIGGDGALVVDSGHVPSLTRRMIINITRLTNKPGQHPPASGPGYGKQPLS